ncbi:inositol 2-dehydrogenase [Spirochaetia bacterium]|nr:inositol 2-dehydrogenase [Spirochaetia bacterium]
MGKELTVGVIGAGAIGTEHIERITNKLSGARVVAVTDVDTSRAEKAAAISGARVEKDGQAVIAASDVEAVVVTSWGPAHAESILGAIAAGKMVFCEKPMTTTAADAKKVVDAEIARGKKFTQVGFMRRYDKGYLQMKEVLASGKTGKPLMIHCAHRNVTKGTDYNTPMSVNDTAIHEIDVLHWLVGDQYVSAQVLFPKQTSLTHTDLRDPQLMILTTESGILIEIEVFVNCQFGYDIKCEVVCEKASVELPLASFPSVKLDAKYYTALETDWKYRFIDSYDVEIQDWINTASKGIVTGPNAWDGYLAAVTADALVRAQSSGKIEGIATGPCPDFYK